MVFLKRFVIIFGFIIVGAVGFCYLSKKLNRQQDTQRRIQNQYESFKDSVNVELSRHERRIDSLKLTADSLAIVAERASEKANEAAKEASEIIYFTRKRIIEIENNLQIQLNAIDSISIDSLLQYLNSPI